ncbi:hypothetical protein DFJ58DRAFT_793524 [Suillus subalutaceus]|uniref:uncharacterized protein n=1 Tax=Suillus subalutaceus TaxID=48586 RepID=UPI001B865B16|nr:uncharacterized protein DFJ58DRAFT_793524 [Suillus subalutaceus]KAG1850610.1 hypothetical protein DFJ58DRAFT_793524 [Suillus subalutaceus]
MVCRGFASPVGSSRGLRGRNVTVRARQVNLRWFAFTFFIATCSIPTSRIHALPRSHFAFLDRFAFRIYLRLVTPSMKITHLPPIMYCTDAISLHVASELLYVYARMQRRRPPTSLFT